MEKRQKAKPYVVEICTLVTTSIELGIGLYNEKPSGISSDGHFDH